MSRFDRAMAAAMAVRMASRSSPIARFRSAGAVMAPRVRSMSARTIAPAGPVPTTLARSVRCVSASRRAAGDIRTRPPLAAVVVGAGDGVRTVWAAAGKARGGASTMLAGGATSAAAVAAGAGAAGAAAMAPAPASTSVRIRASGVPTGTLLLRSTRICSTRPLSKISISMAPFWVSTTATMSPRLT